MKAPALLAVLLVLAPLAAAHGDDRETPYDPLALDLALHPDGAGAMAEAKPQAGAVEFRGGEANAPHPPLDFAYPLPGRFLVDADAKATLRFAVERPMVLQDQAGDSFEVSLLLADKPVEGASAKVKLTQASLGVVGGGEANVAEATLRTKGLAVGKGDVLTLRVRPLMPVVPPGGLKLLVGGETPSALAFPLLRVPTVQDLGLQDAPLDQSLLSAPLPSSSGQVVYYDLQVSHASVELRGAEPANGRRAFLLLRGVEPSEDAHRHHEFLDAERRMGAAHQFQVGDRLVRVHPGVVVKVPLTPGPDGLTTSVACVLNCPENGFQRTLQLLQADDPSGATGGTLIPPPRSTKGIPVSEDAPIEEERNLLPAPALLAVAALAAGGLGLRRARR